MGIKHALKSSKKEIKHLHIPLLHKIHCERVDTALRLGEDEDLGAFTGIETVRPTAIEPGGARPTYQRAHTRREKVREQSEKPVIYQDKASMK